MKRIIAIISLVLMLAVSLTACGGKKDYKTNSKAYTFDKLTITLTESFDTNKREIKEGDAVIGVTYTSASGTSVTIDKLENSIAPALAQKDLEKTKELTALGVQIVKTYDCENFEEVAAACPVPIVVAGGKKLAEQDALKLAYNVMSKGAHGVDMGRNIFQSEHPVEMAKAIRMIVHHKATDKEAYEFYLDATKSGK